MQELINQVVNKASFPTQSLDSQQLAGTTPARPPPHPTPPHTTPQGMCSKACTATSGLHQEIPGLRQEIPGLKRYPKEMQITYTLLEASLLKSHNDSKSTGNRKSLTIKQVLVLSWNIQCSSQSPEGRIRKTNTFLPSFLPASRTLRPQHCDGSARNHVPSTGVFYLEGQLHHESKMVGTQRPNKI